MCSDLNRNGKGYKKIATDLNLSFCTVRALTKKCLKTKQTKKGWIGNHVYLATTTMRRMVKKAKKWEKLKGKATLFV